ncbi:MAG: hypothetical protein JHC73_04315 [Dolichospermum sp.]|nr:hypothetical protein [Dolichospermum sp.]
MIIINPTGAIFSKRYLFLDGVGVGVGGGCGGGCGGSGVGNGGGVGVDEICANAANASVAV